MANFYTDNKALQYHLNHPLMKKIVALKERNFVDCEKYDYVVDIKNKFYKIQCKTSHWCKDTSEEKVAFAIETNCQTTNTKKTIRHKYTENEIDYFYTWFQGQGYLISIKEATGVTYRMRYEYPKTGQKQGIHIANDYKIEEEVEKLLI